MLKLKRPEKLLLEEIIDDLRLYGHVSLVKWIQFRSNLDFIDECRRKVLLIKDLSRYVSLFGEEREKFLFITDFCGDLCYRICDSSNLSSMFSFALRDNSFLRRFLLTRFLEYSLNLYPEETLSLVEEAIYSSDPWVGVEDKLFMAHLVSRYDFGYADDFFNYLYDKIVRERNHESKLLGSIKFAYFYLKSFGDKESKKFADSIVKEITDQITSNPNLQAVSLPYLFDLRLNLAERLFDNILRRFDTTGIYAFLDESFYLPLNIDIYYRLLERGKRLFELDKISYEDYLLLVSKIIRNIAVLDPYLAKMIFQTHTTAFTGLTHENHEKTVEILRNLALVDIDFVYEMTKILIRESERIEDALKILVDLQGCFPRKTEETFKYELLDGIKHLRLDRIIELSNLIYSIKSETARKIISRIIYQIDKSNNAERKVNRLLKLAEKIAKIDPVRSEQLCMYAYELSQEIPINKRIKITGKIVDILQTLNAHTALLVLQETIDLIERTKNQNALIELEENIAKKEHPAIKQVVLYIKSKIKER